MQFQRKVTPFLYIAGRIMRQRGVILDIFKGRQLKQLSVVSPVGM
jgi:hypothetical protein